MKLDVVDQTYEQRKFVVCEHLIDMYLMSAFVFIIYCINNLSFTLNVNI